MAGQVVSDADDRSLTCYPSPPDSAVSFRTLSSDDDSGIRKIAALSDPGSFGNHLPNPSFEMVNDCHDPRGCDDAYYWWRNPVSSFNRTCSSNAYHGSCFERMTGSGWFIAQVTRTPCDGNPIGCGLTWVLRARNTGTLPVTLRGIISNVDRGVYIVDRTWTLSPGSWTELSHFTLYQHQGNDHYRYKIEKTATTEVWFDLVEAGDTT